jgi:hypothetical protein
MTCSICGKELTYAGSEIPTGQVMCRGCCAGKSALDGRAREDIVDDPRLYKIQWAVNGAPVQGVGFQRFAAGYEDWRREGRRLASSKYRKSSHGRERIERVRLSKDRCLFTQEQWLERVQTVFQSRCYDCGDEIEGRVYRVVLKMGKGGKPSRHLKDSVPACRSCKNKFAANSRWKS